MNKPARLTTVAIAGSLLISGLVAPSAAFAATSGDSIDAKSEVIASTDASYASTEAVTSIEPGVALLTARSTPLVTAAKSKAEIEKAYNASVKAAKKLPAAARKTALAKAKKVQSEALKNLKATKKSDSGQSLTNTLDY